MSEVLKAGRELDRLVAEKVVGYREVEWVSGYELMGIPPDERFFEELPRYSTDLAAAAKVLAYIRAKENGSPEGSKAFWKAFQEVAAASHGEDAGYDCPWYIVEADYALTWCLIALKIAEELG